MLCEWWERYRRLLIVIGALVFLGSSIWLYRSTQESTHEEWPLTPVTAIANAAGPTVDTQEPAEEFNPEVPLTQPSPPSIWVDVKGRVKKPGLYAFSSGMRVDDAIRQAGGALPDADLEQINLAQPLLDGAAIVIPALSTAAPRPDIPPVPGQLVASPSPGIAQGSSSSETININTATAAELMSLPGIGEAKAQAILQYRTEKQGFRSPEDIKRISGIGNKLYERLKDRIRIQ